MQLIDHLEIEGAEGTRTIQLLQGDLAAIPAKHHVDILVVSAFKDDYLPTPSSLIGALYRKQELSLQILADDKEIDLRGDFSCWLSKELKNTTFKRILCIESGWRGSPPEVTDDLFRALASVLLEDFPNSVVAMPIVGAGDQGFDHREMLDTIVSAAASWMKRGLPLKTLKIVAHTDKQADSGIAALAAWRQSNSRSRIAMAQSQPDEYDVFLSYSQKDSPMADFVVETLSEIDPRLRIFMDRTHLEPGMTWASQLADALDMSRRIVALYSQNYWTSNNCKSEFQAAFARQSDTGAPLLFPIYLSDASIRYLYKSVQYVDCRHDDQKKIRQACGRLYKSLQSS